MASVPDLARDFERPATPARMDGDALTAVLNAAIDHLETAVVELEAAADRAAARIAGLQGDLAEARRLRDSAEERAATYYAQYRRATHDLDAARERAEFYRARMLGLAELTVGAAEARELARQTKAETEVGQ